MYYQTNNFATVLSVRFKCIITDSQVHVGSSVLSDSASVLSVRFQCISVKSVRRQSKNKS